MNLKSKISRIIGKQTYKGNIVALLITSIPSLISYALYYTTRRKINVQTGLRKYELPLLITYPRSGTNWLRYIIEYVSDRPTPGAVRLINGDNYLIDRAHKGFEVIDNYKKVLLVIRDYRECLIRHNQAFWEKHNDVEELLSNQTIAQPASWYINNIIEFDKYSGEKILIYYEDLITYPEKEIKRIFEFLNIENEKLVYLLNNIDKIKKASIDSYTKNNLHSSITKGESNNLSYHANENLTEQQQNKFCQFYKNNYYKIYEKYLSRYEK
jgi:sulfotransferase family protein